MPSELYVGFSRHLRRHWARSTIFWLSKTRTFCRRGLVGAVEPPLGTCSSSADPIFLMEVVEGHMTQHWSSKAISSRRILLEYSVHLVKLSLLGLRTLVRCYTGTQGPISAAR